MERGFLNFQPVFQFPRCSTETSTPWPRARLVTRRQVPRQGPSVTCGLPLSFSSQTQKPLLGLEASEVFLTMFELGLKIKSGLGL